MPLRIGAGQFQFAAQEAFYYLALGAVAAVLIANRAMERSRFGSWLVAVRENEDAVRALGVDTLKVKLKAISLSAGVTALAGAFYTQKFLYIDANIAYGAWISVEALLAPIIGGVGTVFGPLIGAMALIGLGELAKSAIHGLFGSAIPGVDLVVYGVLLIAVIAFAPAPTPLAPPRARHLRVVRPPSPDQGGGVRGWGRLSQPPTFGQRRLVQGADRSGAARV